MLFAVTFLFEPWIYERRLTLDLNHSSAFANLSKPLRLCSGCWVSELSGAQSVTRFGWPNGLQVSSGAVVRGLTQTDHYRSSQIPRSSVCGDTVKTFAEQVMPAQPQRYFSVVEVCLPTTTSNVRLFAMQLSDCRRMPLQQELHVACRLVANCDPVATFS